MRVSFRYVKDACFYAAIKISKQEYLSINNTSADFIASLPANTSGVALNGIHDTMRVM